MKSKIENWKLFIPEYKEIDKPWIIELVIKNKEWLVYIENVLEALWYYDCMWENTNNGYERTFKLI